MFWSVAFLPSMQRVSRWTARWLQTARNGSVYATAWHASRAAIPLPGNRDFHAIFQEAAVGMQLVDLQGRLVESNAAFQHLLGYSAKELRGVQLTQLMHPDDRGMVADLHRDLLLRNRPGDRIKLRYQSKTGQTMWVWMSVSLVHTPQGAPHFTLGIVEHMPAGKLADEQLTYHAYHDTLTDLPNRLLLQDRLQQVHLTAQRGGTPFAVFLIDLDHFKAVNDTLGHQDGDLLLRQVAIRLQHSLRDSDTVARWGGDEFIALLPTADTPAVTGGAHRILHALTQPFVVDGHTCLINASIGVSLYPVHGDDVGTLLHQADQAMYAAKRSSAGFMLANTDAQRSSMK